MFNILESSSKTTQKSLKTLQDNRKKIRNSWKKFEKLQAIPNQFVTSENSATLFVVSRKVFDLITTLQSNSKHVRLFENVSRAVKTVRNNSVTDQNSSKLFQNSLWRFKEFSKIVWLCQKDSNQFRNKPDLLGTVWEQFKTSWKQFKTVQKHFTNSSEEFDNSSKHFKTVQEQFTTFEILCKAVRKNLETVQKSTKMFKDRLERIENFSNSSQWFVTALEYLKISRNNPGSVDNILEQLHNGSQHVETLWNS